MYATCERYISATLLPIHGVHGGSTIMHREKFFVPVATAASHDAHHTRRLLALFASVDAPHGNASDGVAHGQRFDQVLVYLHGFPDMAVHPTQLDMASRLPFKIAEAWLEHSKKQMKPLDAGFVAFNFGGVPGSDGDGSLAFFDKTISQEVQDAVAVCNYVRESLLQPNGRIHVVGISTGAIIASLLREKRVADTIAVIAGLADLQRGIKYDFSDVQMRQFDASDACWKEFYLPEGCTIPKTAIVSLNGEEEATAEELAALEAIPRKLYFRLHRRYLDECLDGGTLDIKRAVSSGVAPCPLLVIHGDADANVPIADGEELFAVAAEPKTFVSIAKANHLLTNSKHLKKALQAILTHTTQ